MTKEFEGFPQYVAAVAALRGERDASRVAAWQERLSWTLGDLATIGAARPAADPLSLPSVPQLPHGEPAGHSSPGGSGSVAALAQSVARGEVRAAEVARQALAAASAWRHARIFTALDEADVMRQAEAIDAAVLRGEALGPLAGVPFAIKDLVAVQGYRLTGGTLAREPQVAGEDAPVVAALRRAGAVIFGVTNLHELAFGVTSANPHFGAVVNPRFPDRIPGGSSGGSGAAVAAGIVPLALGTDTGGSIRIPAACCGIVGFKPTYGLVDRTGVLPLAWSLDHVGPLAACVEDAALAFRVMAGRVPDPGAGLPQPPSLRLLGGMFTEFLAPEVEQCMSRALQRCRAAGAPCTEVAVDALRLAGAAQAVTIGAEASAANADLLGAAAAAVGEDVRVRLESGQCFLATDYLQAQRLRREIRDAVIAALGDADVLVAPTLPCLPPGVGQSLVGVAGLALPVAGMLTRLTSPFNMTGLPALSIPCGHDVDGLPVSVQLIGRPGEDDRVLAAGRWIESVIAAAPA